MSERTVAAISTPSGTGGISVIRISGDDAIKIADKCFVSFSGKPLSTLKGYTASYGKVLFNDTVIDDAVALVFLAPKSFTGENVVEISVHGGQIVARDALRAVIANGAFLAENGEFTKRAFLNGKLDLSAAESIMEIISAKNETALKISRAAKEGRVSKEIDLIVEKLLFLGAGFATFSDYPDEEIEGLDTDNFCKMLNEISDKLANLLSTYDAGKVIKEGIDACIVGKPNVGKSSIMNLLCGSDRSIVTEIAGTTRDVVESTVTLGDITLNLSDTAGLHDTKDIVEKAGVKKSEKRLETASLVLAVFDVSRPLDDDDIKLLSSLNDNAIVILNKQDLETKADLELFRKYNTVCISAKENTGIDKLSEKILKLVDAEKLNGDEVVLVNERQRNCVKRAKDSIDEALNAFLSGVTLDAVGVCVDEALSALLELTGKRVTNEVTDEIFKRFCVGK